MCNMPAASGFLCSFSFSFPTVSEKKKKQKPKTKTKPNPPKNPKKPTFTLLKISVWQHGQLPKEEEEQSAVVRQGRL